jgi:hypothetical protein
LQKHTCIANPELEQSVGQKNLWAAAFAADKTCIFAVWLWPPLHGQRQPECGYRIVAPVRDGRNDIDHHFDPLVGCRGLYDKIRNFLALAAAEIHVSFGAHVKLGAEASENQGYVFGVLLDQMHGQRPDTTVCANTERTKVHRSEMVPGSSR